MSVLLHVTVFVLPAIWVIWICMMFQFRHAKLGGYVVADDAKREHAWSPYDTDIVRRYFAGSGIQGGVVAGIVLAYLVVAWIVLVVEYIGDGVPPGSDWHTCWARSPPLPRPLQQVIKWCFVLVTLPFALLPFSLILAAIWVLGSAILDPNQFLARTAAFAALVTTLTSIGNQLQGAAAVKASSVRDQLRGRLSAVLETWLREHRDATSGKADDVAARARAGRLRQASGRRERRRPSTLCGARRRRKWGYLAAGAGSARRAAGRADVRSCQGGSSLCLCQ